MVFSIKHNNGSYLKLALIFCVSFLMHLYFADIIFASSPTEIQIRMYHLDPATGEKINILCNTGDTAYGCTAYTGNSNYSYPFDSSTVTVNMESDERDGYEQGYVYNVTPHELGITTGSQGNKPLSSVQAQAIASRSFAGYYASRSTTINNSTQYQVYISFTYEKLNTAQQQRVKAAVSEVLYLSKTNEITPIRAHFGQDNRDWTTAGTDPVTTDYLKSVYDPINTLHGCANYDSNGNVVSYGSNADCGTGNGGMSSKGASRWGFGHTSSIGPVAEGALLYPHDSSGLGDFWSVRWDHSFQILTHYYTGIHIRDANGNILTPVNRWNPLKMDWGSGAIVPPSMYAGNTYYPQIQIQNTGVNAWNSGVKLDCELTKPNGTTVSCPDVTVGVIAPGATVTKTLSIPISAGSPNGVYRLKVDLKNASGWFRSLEASAGKPWHSLDTKLCVGSSHCSENYLPLVLKNYPETYFFETFSPTHSGWIFTGSRAVEAPGRTDGASLRFDKGASARITISVPPNSTPILKYWCKDADMTSYSYPRYDLYLDGVDTTPGFGGNNLSCSANWEQKEQVINATYTSDGQVTIKFQAASLSIWHTKLRFDDILVQSQ